MPCKATKRLQWSLASVALIDAWTDFVLSRQAMNCTKATLEFYRYTAGKFLEWIETQGVTQPEEITARFVRSYLAQLTGKDTTKHDHARAIRTLLRFWHFEGYMTELVKFDMPKLAKKRLPVLTAEQLQLVVKACNVRDKAIVLFMADSGLRRGEVINLNWDDIDFQTGLVRVKQGKGQKDRIAVIGAKTRRALLAYRRTLKDRDGVLIQTETGERFTGPGLLRVFRRLSKRTGIHVTPHAMRRTFTILALRAGMRPLHLQNLGGWESLDMVQHYSQMVDEDLLQEHHAHSPIDKFITKSKPV
jgi:integrase/recombinase XerD